jgi:hypothetical protein
MPEAPEAPALPPPAPQPPPPVVYAFVEALGRTKATQSASGIHNYTKQFFGMDPG